MRTKLLFFITFLVSKLIVQSVGGPFYFGNIGATGPAGATVGATFMAQNGWGGSVCFNALWPKAKNRPSDYHGGPGSHPSILGKELRDQIIAVAGRVVRQVPTGTKRLRLNAEAGLSVVRTIVPSHFIPWNITPNISGYYYEKVNRTTAGLSLRCSLAWAFSRPLGLELGVFSNINPGRSCIGLDYVLTFGHVCDRQ